MKARGTLSKMDVTFRSFHHLPGGCNAVAFALDRKLPVRSCLITCKLRSTPWHKCPSNVKARGTLLKMDVTFRSFHHLPGGCNAVAFALDRETLARLRWTEIKVRQLCTKKFKGCGILVKSLSFKG